MALTHSLHNWELKRDEKGREAVEQQDLLQPWCLWQAGCTNALQGHSCHATIANSIVLVPALLIRAHSYFQKGLALAVSQNQQVIVSQQTGLSGPHRCSQGEEDLCFPLPYCLSDKPLLFRKAMKREKLSSLALYILQLVVGRTVDL